MELMLIIDNLKFEKQNGVIEKYHIAISKQAVYLIHSSNDYTQIINSIFYGIADIASLFENTLGFVGGLLSVTTGEGLSKMLNNFAKNNSDRKIKTVLKNLDKYANKEEGILKLDFENLKQLTYKKGFIINGKSFIEFTSTHKKYKLIPENKSQIDELKKVIKDYSLNTKIVSKIF